MLRNRTRAAAGVRGSSASSSTRALNSSHDSSGLKYCSGAARAGSLACLGRFATRSSVSVTRLRRVMSSGGASNVVADHSGRSGDRAATVRAASVEESRRIGEPRRVTSSAGANHWGGGEGGGGGGSGRERGAEARHQLGRRNPLEVLGVARPPAQTPRRPHLER